MSLKYRSSSLRRRVVATCTVVSCLSVSSVLSANGAGASVPNSSRTAASATKHLRIVGVVAQITDPYFVSIACGARAAATALGNVSVSFQGRPRPVSLKRSLRSTLSP